LSFPLEIDLKKIAPSRFLLPIILTALGGGVLLVAASAFWIIQSNNDMAKQYQLRDGNLIAEGLANAVAPELISKDYGALEERLLQTVSDPNVRSALVVDTQGQVLSYVLGLSHDAPAHPVFNHQKILPPHAEHMQSEMQTDSLSVWHIVKVGIDIGWVRVDIATDHYAEDKNKITREVLGLAFAVTIAGVFLLGAAIFRSHSLLRQREKEVERHHSFLEDKANYDALTQLPNRSLMFDRLNQALAHNARNQKLLAICFVDLDDFKPINDTFGHDAGDQVLIEVSRRLQATVRGDDTVARLGGDEFVVILGEIENAQEAELAVNRLLFSLHEPLITGEKRIDMHASIGYALYPVDSEDRECLLKLSDQAMYQAKSSGGNCVRR
jgi:diguanylate cyclase (GGDEF)-like protein